MPITIRATPDKTPPIPILIELPRRTSEARILESSLTKDSAVSSVTEGVFERPVPQTPQFNELSELMLEQVGHVFNFF